MGLLKQFDAFDNGAPLLEYGMSANFFRWMCCRVGRYYIPLCLEYGKSCTAMSTCTGYNLLQEILTGKTAVTFCADAVLQADRVISSSYKMAASATHILGMKPIELASKLKSRLRNHVP